MEDNFSTAGGGKGGGIIQVGNASDAGDGSGSNESDGERWGAADEALLASPLLTSCCAARFLTGSEQGLGTPGLKNMCVYRNFPSGPVAKASCSQCRGGLGSIPGWGTRSRML